LALLAFGDKKVSAEAVIFDKDGTLIHFEPIWLEVAKARCREIVKTLEVDAERGTTIYRRLLQTMGVNPDTWCIHPRGPLAIAPRFEDMIAVTTGLFLQGYNWDEAREVVRAAFDKADVAVDRTTLIEPVDGMVDMLINLKAAGVKIAIATTDMQNGVDMLVKKLGIAHLVDFVITGDKTPCHKPAPDMVVLACQALGIQASQAVMVGDAPVDMLMGQKAGIGANVAVLTGLTSRELLEPISDIILDSVADITVLEPGGNVTVNRQVTKTSNSKELIIFTDGGSRGNPGPAGIGVAIYENETLIGQIGEYIGETTNNIAEYKALIRGLEECQRLGVLRVRAYADSELLVKQINGQYKVKNEGLIPLFHEIQFLKVGFDRFEISHIAREKNKVADALANEGMDSRK
jgi:ribonuclease HI